MARTLAENRSEMRIMLLVTTLALILRVIAALLTIDIPGDGPARAVLAWKWAHKPSIVWYGLWPPGFTYIAGMACMLIPNVRVATRVLNIVLGTASVPLLYGVARRVHGSAVALAAAVVLALLPLHIGLSASSLTEATFLCLLLALLYAVLSSIDDPLTRRCIVWLSVVIIVGLLMQMVRYEAWGLLPIVAVFIAYRLRSVWLGVCLVAVFLLFPVWWSLQNHRHLGSAVFGIATTLTQDGAPVPIFEALRLLWRGVSNYVGRMAALLMLAGAIDAAVKVARRKASTIELLYLGLAAIMWTIVLALTVRRGGAVWGRYYILALALTIPVVVVWIYAYVTDRRVHLVLAALCLVSFAGRFVTNRPTMYVTVRNFPDVHALIAWRAASPDRDSAVLLTPWNWEATYVPFYEPALAGKAFVVMPGLREADLREFCHWQRPRLLITRADDMALIDSVEQIFARRIGPERLLTAIGQLQVFDISHLADAMAADSRLTFAAQPASFSP